MTEERRIDVAPYGAVEVGQVVAGTYRIERLLGKGGMAAVWEGVSQRTGKRVALKVILGGPDAEGGGAEMLRREALAASRINHPNVVNIYDVIEHEGLTCIVMELLDGEPLRAYLARKGFLRLEEATTLLLPAMRGVAAANALGVIHRDLKPQNVFICVGPDGRMLTTKVLDFGISLVPGRLPDSPPLAQMTPTHGTPAYMSPEHIQGLADLDGRADVYGFGVLFFEALTGQLPFLGPPGRELLMRIVTAPAPRVTVFRPDLPVAFADIVERALAKDPRNRFANVGVFIEAIEACLLPASELPRALTPMAGVPISVAFERSPLTADSAPATGGASSNTKRLFTLSPGEGAERDVPRKAAVEETGGSPVAVRASPAAGGQRAPRWSRYLGALVVFGGMLLFVLWLAFPELPAVDEGAESATGGAAADTGRAR